MPAQLTSSIRMGPEPRPKCASPYDTAFVLKVANKTEREREKEEEKADIKFVSAFRSDLISLHVHYVTIKNRVDLLS